MKKKLALLCAGALVVFGCLFVVGCTTGSGSSDGGSSDIAEITLKNGGIVASIDKAMSVSLEENATTGYVWGYEVKNPDVLLLTDDDTFIGDSDEDVAGAGGMRVFSFEGTSAGTTEILFVHGQGWDDGETIDEDTFTLEVTVDDTGKITKIVEK